MTSIARNWTLCVLRSRRSRCHRCHGEKFISTSTVNLKVPLTPTWAEIDESKLPEVPPLDKEMIDHLERLSLVEFNNKAGVERLHNAIKFANQLYMVNTDGVEPLDNVLEDRELYLRDDVVTEGNCRAKILKNAVKTEEDYFVAPPGNIPLKAREKTFDEDT